MSMRQEGGREQERQRRGRGGGGGGGGGGGLMAVKRGGRVCIDHPSPPFLSPLCVRLCPGLSNVLIRGLD